LLETAGEIATRLETASTLAAAPFSGSAVDVASMNGMRAATQRLQAAYLAYREHSATPEGRREAAMTLEAELGEVRNVAEEQS
jgi:hypothetical protein